MTKPCFKDKAEVNLFKISHNKNERLKRNIIEITVIISQFIKVIWLCIICLFCAFCVELRPIFAIGLVLLITLLVTDWDLPGSSKHLVGNSQ